MEKLDPITLVVATNNFYAILLSALLKSIELNHKTEEKIHVHVIDDGISKKNIELLSKTVSEDMFTLFWHKSTSVIPSNITIPNDKSALPITTYLRLFAPYIIPKETKKMIYLDVDMIVQQDISLLWNTNMGDRAVGAVQAKCKTVLKGIKNYKELGMDPHDKYLNAGLLVIDAFKWREGDMTNRAINMIHDNMKSVTFADQYGLNVMLINKWYELDPRWNSYADLLHDDPYIVHYLNVKPIFSSYKSQPVYFDLFHKYLKQTPFRDFKILSHNRLMFSKVINKIVKTFGDLSFSK